TINVNEGGPVASGDVVTGIVQIGECVGVRKGVPILSGPGTGGDLTPGGLGVPGSVSDPSTDSVKDVVSYLDISGEGVADADVRFGDTSFEYSASGTFLDPGGGKKYSAEIIIPPISSAITAKRRPNSFWFIPEIVDNGI
ncbi:MAG TPA: hypothetical protein PK955_04295, partial [Methanoregulaceae archaeon]|nr:hypothetical protein [Methanoregulaceae archaeon]